MEPDAQHVTLDVPLARPIQQIVNLALLDSLLQVVHVNARREHSRTALDAQHVTRDAQIAQVMPQIAIVAKVAILRILVAM